MTDKTEQPTEGAARSLREQMCDHANALTDSTWTYDQLQPFIDLFDAALAEERALRDVAEERARVAEGERDLAVAHDTQPYPTAHAYETLCKAFDHWRGRAEAAEAALATAESHLAASQRALTRAMTENRENAEAREKAEAELAEARKKNSDLNRRCQRAESAVLEKVQEHPDASLGRALANAGFGIIRRERDDLRAKLAAVTAERDLARTTRDQAQQDVLDLAAELGGMKGRRENFPGIVCLCGSTKFKRAFHAAEARFAGAGVIVLSVGLFGHADCIPLTVGQKAALDELHRRKIDLCDEVYVLNVGGYIGESTAGEIAYAESIGRRVSYLEPPASMVVGHAGERPHSPERPTDA